MRSAPTRDSRICCGVWGLSRSSAVRPKQPSRELDDERNHNEWAFVRCEREHDQRRSENADALHNRWL